MKIRLAALLVLLTAVLAVTAGPAAAQRPIPGITQTVAYKQLKHQVSFLYEKRNVPVRAARRDAYRATLTTRRKKANLKVKALYSQKLRRLSKQDDRKQRRDIKRIRENQKAQVQDLNARLDGRLAALARKQSAAENRITSSYAARINPLADRRDSHRRHLTRTTNPARRSRIIRQISQLQVRINALVSDRSADLDSLDSRYEARAQSVRNLFTQRITKVKSQARKQIQQAQNPWRQTFRLQIQAAKTRRDAQKDIVDTLAGRGFGYIEQMPPVAE